MDGIVGYDPAAATELMSDLVMYAEKGGKGAAPVAAGVQPSAEAKAAEK